MAQDARNNDQNQQWPLTQDQQPNTNGPLADSTQYPDPLLEKGYRGQGDIIDDVIIITTTPPPPSTDE